MDKHEILSGIMMHVIDDIRNDTPRLIYADALEEFGAEYPDTFSHADHSWVERVRGSGKPWPKVNPTPGTARFLVR